MSQIIIRSKVWLESDGQSFLGEGRFRLLAAVDRNGSINGAAKELGISYRKAWAQLKAMESLAPFPLLHSKVGGKNGGESTLTPEIKQLMRQFYILKTKLNNQIDKYPIDDIKGCFNA